MSTINFTREYAQFGSGVRDFEKTPEIVDLLSAILCMYNYPLSTVVGGTFAAIWLGEGDKPEGDEDDLDLIFALAEQPYLEIILRDENMFPVYGGYLKAGKAVKVTDEIVNAYRVIVVTHDDHSQTRHEFIPGLGYEPVASVATASLDVSRRRAARNQA